MKVFGRIAVAAWGMALALAMPAPAPADMVMKFSHHLPPDRTDWRHLIPSLFAEEAAKAGVGLTVAIYPDESLVRARDQWEALVRGTIDFSLFSPAELARGAPELLVIGIPGVIKDHEHARRVLRSPFMDAFRALGRKSGVEVLAGTWLAVAIGSAGRCIETPEDAAGLAIRTSSKALDQLFEAAGALAVAMPSSELSKGLATGAIDALTLPAASVAAARLQGSIRCLTLPGTGAPHFVFVPIMASKASWDRLTPEQRRALTAAAETAIESGTAKILELEAQVGEDYRMSGADIRTVDAAGFAAWRALAERSAWANFAKVSPEAARLLELLRSVD